MQLSRQPFDAGIIMHSKRYHAGLEMILHGTVHMHVAVSILGRQLGLCWDWVGGVWWAWWSSILVVVAVEDSGCNCDIPGEVQSAHMNRAVSP
jgi:hypothetical protein